MTIGISKGHHKPRGVYPPKLPCDIFVICASDEIAIEIALQTAKGNVATLYSSPEAILAAYDAYPMPLRGRYEPYCIRMDEDGAPIACWSLL